MARPINRERREAIVKHFKKYKSKAKTSRVFSITKERVRQVIELSTDAK